MRDYGHKQEDPCRGASKLCFVKERGLEGATQARNLCLDVLLRLKSRSPTGLDLGDQLEDWDMTLEALRDKEIWKHKGRRVAGWWVWE